MNQRLDTLEAGRLQALGFADPERALRILHALPGQGVTDEVVDELLPSLLYALESSPDPDRALNNFERWTGSVTNRYTHYQLLIRHPAALEIFLNVCGTSQLFSDILISNPEYVEILANPGVRGGGKSASSLQAELSGFVGSILRPELKLEAMRRFKQRELLRIGARDILGLSDMPATALEFSNLADACVQKCLEISSTQLEERFGPPPPLAVIGMGKLGGRELNYSSDIDLVFVTSDAPESAEESRKPISHMEYAHKLAEALVNGLSRNAGSGRLFRVDVRLRPEGRFGALVRTLSSFSAYYESWAEPWELQALLKARVVGGDSALGGLYLQMLSPYVYRRSVTSDFVAAIRRNKERMEQKAEVEGKSATNVKFGSGGIRDVEFAVQLLQLERAGRHPTLRTTNTLEALGRLRQVGAITEQESSELGDDYRFLRTVEHRLQILYDLQTQTLPASAEERRLLARRLGYSDAAAFDADYSRRTARVRHHFKTLFLGGRDEQDALRQQGWAELLADPELPESKNAIIERLKDHGFRDAERIYRAVAAASAGTAYGEATPDDRRLFVPLAARLAAAAASTGDPDAAFMAIDSLAQESPNRAEVYRALIEGDELIERLCRLGSGSPELVQLLARRPEWMDLLVSDEVLDPDPKPVAAHRDELAIRIPMRLRQRATGREQVLDALAAYLQRERLRIGARDLWGDVAVDRVPEELSALADSALEALLDHLHSAHGGTDSGPAAEAVRSMAIIGMGKLGGQELGYGSDWDILFVYRSPAAARLSGGELEKVIAVAEALLACGPDLRTRGAMVEIDARLRPEGRFGPLVRSVDEYAAYYRDAAETWEKQSLLKARYIAGDQETASAWMRGAEAALYEQPFTQETQDAILAMKRRIESERLKWDEREADLKLGHGGLSDVEFAIQLLQWKCGRDHSGVRRANTLLALGALAACGALSRADHARLTEGYALLTAVRNRLALRGGISVDSLPEDPVRMRAIAVGMGYVDSRGATAEEGLRSAVRDRMRENRRAFERVFQQARPIPEQARGRPRV